jgi:hypothetical protein
MKHPRFITAASGLAAAAVGLALGLSGSAGAATPAAPAAPRYVVFNCENQAQVRPGTIYLACADDGAGLTHLHWTSWTPELASAYGTEWQNDCLPNCAEGHIHDYPVVVVLWGSASVQGHPGERRYTETTLTYPKARPAVYTTSGGKVKTTYPVSQVWPLGV